MSSILSSVWSARRSLVLGVGAALALWSYDVSATEPVLSYDPAKIVANESENCAQCHARAVQAWTQSTHKRTFDELHLREEAKTVLTDLGMSGSIRRNDECVQCHYTLSSAEGGDPKTVMGISCQRCHGAAVDWLAIHQDVKGRPDRDKRLAEAAEHGMLLTDKIYELASNCYRCHTVPREDLVNKGHHKAGSEFELVKWSQGEVRHNFLPLPDEAQNKEAPVEEKRLMYVIGKLLDMEYTLRSLAVATAEGDFLTAMGERANRVLGDLTGMGVSGVAEIDAALKAVPKEGSAVKVAAGNATEYLAAADAISKEARAFEAKKDSYASKLSAVDSKLPTEYQGKAFE